MENDDRQLNQTGQPNPKGTLMVTRIIWAALLMGQLMFLVVILVMKPGAQSKNPETARLISYVAIGMFIAVLPVAFILRKVIYGGTENVAPGKYATGNIVFLALFEGVSFMGLVAFMLGGMLGLVAAGFAMAMQAVNFPSGSAMGLDQI